MANISIIGLNHTSASIDIREQFAPSADEQVKLLDRLAAHAEEAVVLATCNRTEIIYSASGARNQAAVRDIFLSAGKLPQELSDSVLYTYHDTEALIHLYRVACALDSMIPGETQITGQIKAAFELAFRQGTVQSRFNRIYQHMLQTAKRVRNYTGLGEGAVSISSVAVQLAQHVYENLSGKQVLLVGAGDMCELAADHFQAAGVAGIGVANRSLDRARALASRVPRGKAYPLSELATLLARYDIIFSSTASEEAVITASHVRQAMEDRRGQPLFLIDISVPRDIEPGVGDLPDVYLYNIDSLQQLVKRNLESRHREADKAEQIVREQVQQLLQEESQAIGPLIRSLHDRVQTIKQEQLQKLYQREGELTEQQRDAIDQSVDRIINKMLHDPLISLRRGMQETERQPRNVVSLFKYLFNL